MRDTDAAQSPAEARADALGEWLAAHPGPHRSGELIGSEVFPNYQRFAEAAKILENAGLIKPRTRSKIFIELTRKGKSRYGQKREPSITQIVPEPVIPEPDAIETDETEPADGEITHACDNCGHGDTQMRVKCPQCKKWLSYSRIWADDTEEIDEAHETEDINAETEPRVPLSIFTAIRSQPTRTRPGNKYILRGNPYGMCEVIINESACNLAVNGRYLIDGRPICRQHYDLLQPQFPERTSYMLTI